ncbi:hypothetical protein FQN49_008422, partial [Arthroderma sp. PD_2]
MAAATSQDGRDPNNTPSTSTTTTTSTAMAAADKSPAAKEAATESTAPSDTASNSASTPAPYSTRSRNRVGARINYAEDNNELDAELEQPIPTPAANANTASAASTHTKGTPGRKPKDHSAQNNRIASPASNSERTAGVSTRRANAAAAAVNGT